MISTDSPSFKLNHRAAQEITAIFQSDFWIIHRIIYSIFHLYFAKHNGTIFLSRASFGNDELVIKNPYGIESRRSAKYAIDLTFKL